MNKVNIDLKKLYGSVEVAKLLNLSHVTIFNKIKKGILPAQKIGRNYVIKGEDLNEFLNPSKKLSEKRKQIIEQIVKKVVTEYGDALIKLGKE